MLTSTLGGLIKDYRIKKRLSQLEVSLHIGWKDTTRLSKIEQGRVGKPTRPTIDKIIEALKLSDPEKGEFLLSGRYLPTEEEIEKIRGKTKKLINDWPYPAVILDFGWRMIDMNQRFVSLYQLDKKMKERVLKEHLTVLEIIFDPELAFNKSLTGAQLQQWQTLLKYVTMHFRFDHRHNTKERWFISLIRRMLENDLFRKIWTSIQVNDNLEGIVGKFAIKCLANPQNMKEMLNFYLFLIPILEDARFEMEVMVPIDIETYRYFRK